MSNFAVNSSNKAGTVFFGEKSEVIGPYGKLELTSMPSFWTKNIQLVKGLTRSRGKKPSTKNGSGVSVEEVSNG